MQNALAEAMGLTAEWVKVRLFWNGRDYDTAEESVDGQTWTPYSGRHNVASQTYIGGPKDGKVEW